MENGGGKSSGMTAWAGVAWAALITGLYFSGYIGRAAHYIKALGVFGH